MRAERGLPTAPLPPTLNLQFATVNVELPLPVSIPTEYIPGKDVRLGVYRRMADIKSLAELDALAEEFKDRFGPLPETVQNLFFQLKVKLLAEKAGLASIAVDSGQLALRFPDNLIPPDLPDLGPNVRVGKVALWMPYAGAPTWAEQLLEVLAQLKGSD
jgi:transcription-repair coupling factor (superfamily II helicase)